MDERARPTKVEYLMGVAHLTSHMSTCGRLQVGAVLATEDLTQFVVGYNGGARGGKNSCLHPDVPGGCGCAHAEMNAVAKATPGIHVQAFLTDSPCELCATLLVNMGVVNVTFLREYRIKDGLDVLRRAGVQYQEHVPSGIIEIMACASPRQMTVSNAVDSYLERIHVERTGPFTATITHEMYGELH